MPVFPASEEQTDRGIAGPRALGDHALEQFGQVIGLALGQHPLHPIGDLADRSCRWGTRPCRSRSRRGGCLRRRGLRRRRPFQRRDAVRETADRLRRNRFKRCFDSHFVGSFGHVFWTDVEIELGEDDVDRIPGGAGQRHRPAARLGVVDRPGAAARDFQGLRRAAVVVGRLGIDPLPERVAKDEGLKRGARLAVRLPGVVELFLLASLWVEASATISPVGRIDRGKCRRPGRLLGSRPRRHRRLPGVRLKLGVNRRVGLQAAVANGVDPVAFRSVPAGQGRRGKGHGLSGTCGRGAGRDHVVAASNRASPM